MSNVDDWQRVKGRRGWPLVLGAGLLTATGLGVAGVAAATTSSSPSPDPTGRSGAMTLPTIKPPVTSTTTTASTTTTTTPSAQACTPESAAQLGNLFLSIPGITMYGNSIFGTGFDEINEVSFGAKAAGAGSSGAQGAGGRASAQDIIVTKAMTPDDLKLFSASLSGQHLATVVITTGGPCSAQGTSGTIQTLTLSDVLVSSFSSAMNPPSVKTDTITFNYGKISVSRNVQTRDGKWGSQVAVGFNQQTGVTN